MENQTVCSRRIGVDHGGCDVSVVAYDIENRGVVLEHGHAGLDWAVFCHGYFQGNTVWRNVLCGSARLVVVSESLRGCGLL